MNAAWPGVHVGSAASLGRGGFDRSLNDRDGGATWAPEQTYQGALQAHAGTLGASKEMVQTINNNNMATQAQQW